MSTSRCTVCGTVLTPEEGRGFPESTIGICMACEEAEQAQRQLCPACHGTNLSPYPEDGGSFPHCFLGYR